MSDFVIKFKKLKDEATIPSKGSKYAAGLDLSSSENASIPARQRGCIPTGLAIDFPEGQYARIAPRSGLALKKGIDTGAGVVDSDQRGEIKVILFNHSDEEFVINTGDRIAQMIIEKIAHPVIIEEVLELSQTVRGEGGFGSTGTN